MSRFSLGQKGFSAVEALLCIIIVGIIGGTGYYIYHANQKTNNTFNAATQSANSSPAKITKKATKTTSAAANPLIYADDTGKVYQVSLLAKTTDEKGIAAAFDKSCSTVLDADGTGTAEAESHVQVGVVAVANLFTGSELYATNGKFARISGACYDKTEGGAQWGGGAVHYFSKQNGTWSYITGTQSEVDCETVDGKGAGSLVPKCFDATTNSERAPK